MNFDHAWAEHCVYTILMIGLYPMYDIVKHTCRSENISVIISSYFFNAMFCVQFHVHVHVHVQSSHMSRDPSYMYVALTHTAAG